MAYIEVLENKYSEIKDLRSRGLLHLFYEAAWDDVMKIVRGKHPNPSNKKPIMLLAEENGCVVRIACSSGSGWVGTIRKKQNGSSAMVFNNTNYYDLENTLREKLDNMYIRNNKASRGDNDCV